MVAAMVTAKVRSDNKQNMLILLKWMQVEVNGDCLVVAVVALV